MFKIDNQFVNANTLNNLPHRHIVHKGKHIEHLPEPYEKAMLLCGSITSKTPVNQEKDKAK